MRSLALGLLFLSCATVDSSVSQAPAPPLEVNGRVTAGCAMPRPLQAEEVRLRFAGELDAALSVQTDLDGTFTAQVVPRPGVATALFVEARGVRTVARQTVDVTRRGLVAELVLPCGEAAAARP